MKALTQDAWHDEFSASNYDLLENDSSESHLDIIIRMFADDRLYRITAPRIDDSYGSFTIARLSDC